MQKNNIKDILYSTEWAKNISLFLNESVENEMDYLCKVISIFSIQIEFIEENNNSICFIREMQFSLHQAAALIGIGLYKASVCSLRTFVESFLYYSYFRSHPSELNTLYKCDKFYISKKEVMEYHNIHTEGYNKRNNSIKFEERLNAWYSKSSSIIHGQIPGTWNTHDSLLEIEFSKDLFLKAMLNFNESINIVFSAIVCTVDDEIWQSFTFELKEMITKKMNKKDLIHIDRTII